MIANKSHQGEVQEILGQQRQLKLTREKVANILNKNIFVINGDQGIREGIKGNLETLGFAPDKIDLSNSSAEIVKRLKLDPTDVDVVICPLRALDNRTSAQTGLQLLKIVKEMLLSTLSNKSIPFIFLERDFEKKDIINAFRAGASQFIVYPSNPIDVGNKLAEVFEKPKESLLSQEISKLLFEGNKLQEQGLFDNAIAVYNKALKIGGESANVLTEKGNTLLKMGDLDDAIQVFKRATVIETNFPRAYQGLGSAYAQIGDTQEAKANYEKVIELEPDNVLVHYNVGVIYQDEGDYDSAKDFFEEGTRLNGKFVKNYLGLAKNYEAQDKHEEALKTYKKGIKHNPDKTFLYVTAGDFCLKHGLNQDAENIFNDAISSNETHIHLYNRMGIALRKQKKFDKAITNFAKAIKIKPKDATLRYNWAKAYYLKGDELTAVEKLQKAFALDDNLKDKFMEDRNFSKLMGKYPDKFII